MFERRHYDRLAEEFAHALSKASPEERNVLLYMSGRFADVFATDNPRFNRHKWDRAVLKGGANAYA